MFGAMLQETALKIKDLGDLSAPTLLFGGPYSNLHALEAMKAWADAQGISPSNTICTGDVAAYCAYPEECTQTIKDWGIHVLAGNCEINLAAEVDDCGCGFEEGTACSLLSKGWYPFASAEISHASRQWMGACPDRIAFRFQGKRFAVIHGGTQDVSAFIWPTSDDEMLRSEINHLETQVGALDGVIAGHSGIPMKRNVAGIDWLNAGVIGMPANNGQSSTDFLVLTEAGPEFHKLNYDWNAAQQAMIKAGLVQGYHQTLETGYWPSEDILPPELRKASQPADGGSRPVL